MKIAIVTPVFPPYRGGIGMVARAQAKIFADSGHEVTVFTPDYGKKIPGEKYRLEYVRPFLKYGNAACIPQLLWKLHGFDAVILHYPFFGAAELFLLRISKIRPVIFYHMDVRGRGLLGAFFRAHQKYIMPLIIGRAGKVIVTSLDYARSGALKNLISAKPDKFIEIPLGVDTERFAPRERDATLAAKLKIVPTDKVILFVGGLDSAHYFKGVDILLRAFKKCAPHSKLIIVGEGNLRPSYEALAKELVLGERVLFAGSASEEDLPKYYNLADLFVLSSIDRSEAFGIVILEALASGVPVVASNIPGVRTLIKEGTGLLAEPGNVDDLADKITACFSKDAPEARERARSVGEEYSIGKIAEKWIRICA